MNTFLLIWFLSGFLSYLVMVIRYEVGVWESFNLNYIVVFSTLGIITVLLTIFLIATDRK